MDEQIRGMFDEYAAAARAKDVDRFLALFDPDVRAFDMWDRWSYDGLDSWREMASGWFGGLGSEMVAVEFDDVQIITGQDVAAASAFVTYRGLSADGEELRSMNNRLSWVLRKAHDGTWKVVHEHTSAPIDPPTGKVNVQRQT